MSKKLTLRISLDSIFKIILLSAVMIQVFAYYLSFYDIVVEGGWIQSVIDLIYKWRDICLFLSLTIVVLKTRLRKDSIALVVALIFIYVVTSFIQPENLQYFEPLKLTFILAVQVYIVMRSRLFSLEEFKRVLHVLCRVLFLLSVYIFVSQQSTLFFQERYMDFSNATGIVCGILFYYGISEKKKLDLVFASILYVILLVAGGRGSFLTLSLLIIVLVWMNTKSKWLFVVGALVIIMFFVMGTGIFETILTEISSGLGFESRTISRIFSARFFARSDRQQIYDFLWGKIKDDMFLGGGLCADRYYLYAGGLSKNGYYAHNFFIEMIVDFGFIGIMISVALLVQFVRFFISSIEKRTKSLALVFIFVSFVQLMLSRSWLTEANFFLMLALITNSFEDNRWRGENVNE